MSEKEINKFRDLYRSNMKKAQNSFGKSPAEFKAILAPYVKRMIEVEGLSAPVAWYDASCCQIEQWSEQRDS